MIGSMVLTAITLPGTEALSFGGSKLFQIVTPLAVYIFLQETPGVKQVVPNLIRRIHPKADLGWWQGLINMFLGFTAWKIGCDFGFLIINTSAAPWSIAFTWAGLIPYAIGMYVIYYLIGTKIIIQGQLNPFKDQYVPPKFSGRPSIVRQFISKFFHESLNTTSANVPMRQVVIKPFIDYGAILITWPLYNVALLFSQSGEINFAPMIHFTFLSILVFYIVNVLGFILGFNLGEFIYFQAHYLIESLKRAGRQAVLAKKINDLWEAFDENKDGSISEDELRKVMRALGQDPGNAELLQLLREADLDQSGSIELDEFKTLLGSNQKSDLARFLQTQIKQEQGVLRKITSAIAIQWQLIKNNTTYIRIQGFLRRYGLNNRWLLSGGFGLIAIVLLEPKIASALFGFSDQVSHTWFYRLGEVDSFHLAQVLDPGSNFTGAELPDPEGLTTIFPTQIAEVYPRHPETIISYLPSKD